MAIGRSLCQTRLSAERPRLGRYAPAHRRTGHQRRQAGGALDRGRNAGKSDHADVGRLSDLGAAGPRRSLADRTVQALLQPDTGQFAILNRRRHWPLKFPNEAIFLVQTAASLHGLAPPQFAEAVALAEAPAHGAKPLFVPGK